MGEKIWALLAGMCRLVPVFPAISLLSFSLAIAGPCALSPPSSCDRLAAARCGHGRQPMARRTALPDAGENFLARGLAPQLEVLLIAAALSARCGTTVSDGETK